MKEWTRTLALACLCGHGAAVSALADQSWRTVSRPVTPLPRSSGDLLLFRDGRRMTGSLVGCGGSACRFNGITVERGRIEWIGLGGVVPPPPQLDTLAEPRVFLIAGGVKKESLVGVNTREVVTDGGSYPRSDVRWIYLAPPPSGADETQGSPTPIVATTPAGADQGTTGSSPTPPIATPPPLTPGPPATRTPRMPTATPTASTPTPAATRWPTSAAGGGAIWVGTVKSSFSWRSPDGAGADGESTIAVRLQEVETQPEAVLRATGRSMAFRKHDLLDAGSHFTGRLSGYSHGGGVWCSGGISGGFDARSRVSEIVYKDAAVDLAATPLGFDIPVGAALYHLAFYPNRSVPCPNSDTLPAMPVLIGQMKAGSPPDPEVRLLEDRGTHMQGSYAVTFPDPRERQHIEVSWDVCRVGSQGCSDVPVEPTAPPPSASPTPPCGGTDPRQALWEHCREQRALQVERLRNDWNTLKERLDGVESNQEAWKAAMATCGIADILTAVATSAAGEWGDALSTVNNLLTGSIGWMIDPTSVASPIFAGTQNEISNFPNGWLAAAQGKLLGCSANLPNNLYDAAKAFLDNMQGVADLVPQVRKDVNDVRQKDIECADRQWDAYQACLERARCEGRDASACAGLRPAGAAR